MLLSFMPPTFVLAAISPVVKTEALLLIIEVLAVVTHTIRVNVDSVATHVVVQPLAIEFTTVLPQVSSVPINLIIDPIALIG
jgi:hypothetical protein